LVVDWGAEDTQSKASPNPASGHPLARVSKAEAFEAALVAAVVAFVGVSEVIEAVSVVTEVALAGIEVGSAVEGGLATKAQVASEGEEDSQMVHLHRMRQADQAGREAVGMAVGTELVLPTVRALTMATGVVAMGTAWVVTEIIVAARAARQGLTAVEINVAE
jgi:hypothetical protein